MNPELRRARAVALVNQLMHKASDKTDFMNDCVPYLMDQGKDQDQAIAMCLYFWESAPSTDESESE